MSTIAPANLSIILNTRRAKHSDLNRHPDVARRRTCRRPRASLARRRARPRSIPPAMTMKNDGHGSVSMDHCARVRLERAPLIF